MARRPRGVTVGSSEPSVDRESRRDAVAVDAWDDACDDVLSRRRTWRRVGGAFLAGYMSVCSPLGLSTMRCCGASLRPTLRVDGWNWGVTTLLRLSVMRPVTGRGRSGDGVRMGELRKRGDERSERAERGLPGDGERKDRAESGRDGEPEGEGERKDRAESGRDGEPEGDGERKDRAESGRDGEPEGVAAPGERALRADEGREGEESAESVLRADCGLGGGFSYGLGERYDEAESGRDRGVGDCGCSVVGD